MKTGQKIREIRLSKGMKLAEVENRAGIANGNLSRIERGDQWISEEKLEALADALNVQVADFFKSEKFDVNVRSTIPGSRAIPVISYVQAGELTEVSDPYPVGTGFDLLYTDIPASEMAFALEIEGNSMLPDFQPGDRVIIDPTLSPRPGDCVVAKNGEHEATFKKYRPRGFNVTGSEIFELVPLNEDYPTLRSDIQHLAVFGVMIEHRKYRRK